MGLQPGETRAAAAEPTASRTNKVWMALRTYACIALLAGSGWAAGSQPRNCFCRMTRKDIAQTLKSIHARNPSIRKRIVKVSEYFLGTPYKLGPLGEGPTGEFDRDPLINFKAADCTTLIEQVMALSLESDLDKAVEALQKIRYKNGKIAYETRNHFTELDWVPNNVAAGFLTDITLDVGKDKARWVTKTIKKRDWYASKTLADIQGFEQAPAAEKEERLAKLKTLGAQFGDQVSTIPFIPIEFLPKLLPRIPSGTIANLVRIDLPDRPSLISHQVLIVGKGGVKYVRHAAFNKQVEDVPAMEYFHRYDGSKWKLLGVNLNAIRSP